MTTTEQTSTSLRRRTVLVAVVSAIGLAAAARAGATAPALVDLQVVDRETGQTAPIWRRGGRLYVAGRPGARYSLRVTNNSPGRVLVVMSVDGVNILTGQTAGYGQRGYVFDPYQSYDVSGWRKSDSEIAAFTFAPLSRSYAARTGRPDDVGVIGLAAFTERVVEPLPVAPAAIPDDRAGSDWEERRDVVAGHRMARAPAAPPPAAARASPSAEAASRSEKLGTGHGAREWSVVTSVPFERATSYPQLVRRIEYDSYENLVASGVIPRAWPRPYRPRPFPSSPERNGYVPDPPDAG